MADLENESQHLVLLGPQPEYQTLRESLDRLCIRGRVGLITAGWEDSEPEDEPIIRALPNRVHNLRLFQRTEKLFAEDPRVIELLQRRQDELRHLREVYRMRVGHLMESVRCVAEARTDLVDFSPELESALEMLRQLDREYFLRTCQLCDRYDDEIGFDQRPSIVAHRAALRDELQYIEALLIAGGHAAIILNRLKIFAILDLMPNVPVIAWSGGAMALASQLVFFHDRMPHGDCNPEVLRAGLGITDSILPFPDPKTRLNLNDHERMSLLARRFNSNECVLLDEQAWVERRQGIWEAGDQTRCLSQDGIAEVLTQ